MKLYVGNLAFETSESQINELFSQHGEVLGVTLILDRMTGRSRGFGFVEMSNADAARAAIGTLDGRELGGRQIKVDEAKPRNGATSTQPKRW